MTPKTFLQLAALFFSGVLSAHAAVEIDKSGSTVQWSYLGTTGPAHWGMLNPDFEVCDTGRAQSPINIGRKRVPIPYTLKLQYHSSPMFIGDNLDTRLKIDATHTIVTTAHGLQLNFHDKNSEKLTFNGKEYVLKQFHFHSPSETTWHKQAFPLEIHLVHEGKDGALVLAIFVKGGDENRLLKTILNHLPEKEEQEYAVPSASIDPSGLMPSNLRYYTFTGSLTTPPCTEGLQWIVMPQPITASPAQILKIRDASGGTNARPIQPMNGRILYYADPHG